MTPDQLAQQALHALLLAPHCLAGNIQVEQQGVIMPLGRDREEYSAELRIDRGVGTLRGIQMLEDSYHRPLPLPSKPFLLPSVGRFEEGYGALQDFLHRFDGAVELHRVEDTEEGLVLVSNHVLEGGAEAELRTWLEGSMRMEGRLYGRVESPRGRISALRWELQFDDSGLPVKETLRARSRQGVWTMWLDAEIRYSLNAVECEADPTGPMDHIQPPQSGGGS